MEALNHTSGRENTEPWKTEFGNLFPWIFAGTTGRFHAKANAVADIIEPFKSFAMRITEAGRKQFIKVQTGFWWSRFPHLLDFHPIAQQKQINMRAAPV